MPISSVFIIRHAERLDHIDKQWQPDLSLGISDPPITAHGQHQAIETGHALHDLILQQNPESPQIIIYTSPFQRCIDTSIGLAQQLPWHVTLRLEIGLSEWLSEEFFESVCPAAHLISHHQERLARQQTLAYSMRAKNQASYFPSHLHIDYGHQSVYREFEYPEDYKDMIERFERTRLACLKQADDQNKAVVIFVTHAVGANALLDGFRNRVTIPLKSNYCSLSCVRPSMPHSVNSSDQSEDEFDDLRIRPAWKIELTMSDTHLTK
ncbi:Transcription factor tau subunit [Choanephora cucurbitarum]|uniref:Transcription factor tau subunit n=1 Tax=Choanephora cucurbitarum TaxID=101091 RepID=A0A1C7N0V6_9FUNG|nr:Transcription factor tau subunit [Choanephora cucurbitarum]